MMPTTNRICDCTYRLGESAERADSQPITRKRGPEFTPPFLTYEIFNLASSLCPADIYHNSKDRSPRDNEYHNAVFVNCCSVTQQAYKSEGASKVGYLTPSTQNGHNVGRLQLGSGHAVSYRSSAYTRRHKASTALQQPSEIQPVHV